MSSSAEAGAGRPGRFITFEGGEGTGKSTQVRLLMERLAASGLEDDGPWSVALSLGAPAPTTADPRLVSNLARVQPTFAPKTR